MSIEDKRSGWIPYLFATDSLGTAVGAAVFSSGNFQPQSSLFGAGFVTSNESALISGALNNVRFGSSRWFFEDLKWSAGIGLRFMAFRNVVRLDFATSDEGSSIWAMFAQPFSRQGN